jgi:heme/copper-type cytochrome/quinol oxidase subunit 4
MDVCRAARLPVESLALGGALRRKITMAASKKSGNVIAKYLPVYLALLAIAIVEVFLAYQHFSTGSLLAILLALAFCGGTLALRYFMHLAQETRGLFLTLIPAVIFVLLMMNMIWSDSFRLLHMRPFGH